MWSSSCRTNWLFLPVVQEPMSVKKTVKDTHYNLRSHSHRCNHRCRRAHKHREEELNSIQGIRALIRALNGVSLNPLPWYKLTHAQTRKHTYARPRATNTTTNTHPLLCLSPTVSLISLICILVNTLIASH